MQFQIGSDAILFSVAIRFENHRVTSYKEFSKLSGNTIKVGSDSSHVKHSNVIHLIYPKYNTCGRGDFVPLTKCEVSIQLYHHKQ